MPKISYHVWVSFAVVALFGAPVLVQANFSLSFIPSASSIAQGGSAVTSINANGSTATDTPIVFAVSQGLPAGLSVSFDPQSCAPPCNSLMTVAADHTTAPGSYSIPIVGAAIGQTATTTFALTITSLPQFDFSTSLSSYDGSIAAGEQVDTTVNLGQLSGTSGDIALSASGQPSGVDVSFNPSSCTAPCSALVTFRVSSITSGVYPIIISATAGSITKRSIYYLHVTPTSLSNFALSMYPQNATIKRGESANAIVNVIQLSGTSQEITLSISNRPASTTIDISPSSCTPLCNAVLSISTDESMKAGTYPIVVLGYSGGFTKSITYNLVVSDPYSGGGSTSGYVFTRSLYRRMRGDDVYRLQQYLATDAGLYPEGTVTGYYGALTQKAVGRFQIKYGIVSSASDGGWGMVGPRTRAKLNLLLSA